MTLEFRVLWFEDQLANLQGDREQLSRVFGEEGIHLAFDDYPVATREVLEDVKQEQRRFHTWDLVVLDYNLDNAGMKGNEVAARIRRDFGFTPMVFYSGAALSDLRARLTEQNVDGVFCVRRTDLRDFLLDRADDLFLSANRIDRVRNMAIVELADFDKMLREIVEKRTRTATRTDTMPYKIEAFLDEAVSKELQTRMEAYGKLETFEAKLSSHFAGSARLLELALQCFPGADLPTPDTYRCKILNHRNLLGHAVEVRAATGIEVRAADGRVIEAAEFRALRNDFREVRTIIETAHRSLIPEKAK